jgi:hypothetical protein
MSPELCGWLAEPSSARTVHCRTALELPHCHLHINHLQSTHLLNRLPPHHLGHRVDVLGWELKGSIYPTTILACGLIGGTRVQADNLNKNNTGMSIADIE